MSSLQDWINHGEEMRRPLMVNSKLGNSSTVVIVGGGLSGMCCAYRIATRRPDVKVVILEQLDRLGGVVTTWQDGEWICDLAVNATRPHPAFWRLVDDLGLASKFKPSRHQARARWVLSGGKRHRLSWRTLLKIGPLKLWRSVKQSKAGGRSVAQVIPHKAIADALCLGIVNDTAEYVDADFLLPSLTGFGDSPPIKRRKLTQLIAETYPIFTPKKGSIASIEGGMTVLIQTLNEELLQLENVDIKLNQTVESAQTTAERFGIGVESVVWAAPGDTKDYSESQLSIFAIGYRNEQVAHVGVGYGTLIPDAELPISGILHESDLHHSQRAPNGYRLFRLMVPHNRWNGDEQTVLSCAEDLLGSNPELFVNLGIRSIPRYQPGYLRAVAKMSKPYSRVGWAVSGVSITHIVDEAERIAELFIK